MSGIFGILSKNFSLQEGIKKIDQSIIHSKFQYKDQFSHHNFTGIRIHSGIFNTEPQPIFNEDHSMCIFFDGKIYDYQDDIQKLLEKGHVFSLSTDAEYCLHAFEEYGASFVQQLNGSFIFLIYNLETEKIIIANDRFGFRVHYYFCNENGFVISPEAKGILPFNSMKKELNAISVAEFFAFGEFWEDKTNFKDIHILPPAVILIFDEGNVSLEKYWKLCYKPDYSRTEDEFVDDLIRTFRYAINIRMQDNLRYGITLSGGLDSRSVLAGMDPDKRKQIVACTFGSDDCDEVIVAKKVVETAGVQTHIIIHTPPESIIENALNDVWLTEGRNYIGVSFAHAILNPIKEKVDVIFDGFAMDLTLGGSYLNNKISQGSGQEELFALLKKKRLFSDDELKQLFNSDFFSKIEHVPEESFTRAFQKALSEHPWNTSDKFAMDNHVAWMHIGDAPLLNYVEVVHPSSDNGFIEIITKIPPEFRLNHAIYRKFLMKLDPDFAKIPYQKTMVRVDYPLALWDAGLLWIILKEYLKRKIFHFSKGRLLLKNTRSYVNFYEWFFTNPSWYEFLKKNILTCNKTEKMYLNQQYIEMLWHEHENKEKDHSIKLLYIATFKIFLSQYFNGNSDKFSSFVLR
jgi:asparagine synthase (glutamine-hydrolysing)